MPKAIQKKPQAVERLPSTEDGISALASAAAPIIFFDHVGAMGIHRGVAHLSLQAARFTSVDGKVLGDRTVVAHLRMTMASLRSLKEDLSKIELLAQPAQNQRN